MSPEYTITFPSEDVINYIETLAENGIKEITLLGQNVNQYGSDSSDVPFYKLLERAAQTKGLIKINFLTSHPKDFDENIIYVIRDNENISRGRDLSCFCCFLPGPFFLPFGPSPQEVRITEIIAKQANNAVHLKYLMRILLQFN